MLRDSSENGDKVIMRSWMENLKQVDSYFYRLFARPGNWDIQVISTYPTNQINDKSYNILAFDV